MKTGAGRRLTQVLAMVAYLAEEGEATYEELADRFGLSPERVAIELERATMCEIPPFTGSSLFDLDLDDTGVTTRDIATFLRTPPTLTPEEGFAILVAGRAMLATENAGRTSPLRSALDKLGAALALDPDAVDFDVDRPEQIDDLNAAVSEHHRLEITYYTASRDETTTRRIDPVAVHNTAGRWYVDAFDHASSDFRKFRVDRIEALHDTGETFEPRDPPPEPVAFTPGADAQRVRVRLPGAAEWVAETYPVSDRADHPDGSFEVTFHVVGTTWLERLLLRVGPEAAITDPGDLADLGAVAAERILRLYR